MSPRTRIKTHALAGGFSLVLSTLLLAGCDVTHDDDEPSGEQSPSSEQSREEKLDTELWETQIKLKDGRTVTCVKLDAYKDRGGLSCDWNNTKAPGEAEVGQ